MRHRCEYFSTKILLIEFEGRSTIAVEIEIWMKFHNSPRSPLSCLTSQILDSRSSQADHQALLGRHFPATTSAALSGRSHCASPRGFKKNRRISSQLSIRWHPDSFAL